MYIAPWFLSYRITNTMKQDRFDKKWKDVYFNCFIKLESNCFVATISLNKNVCHLIFIKSKFNFEERKDLNNCLQQMITRLIN